MTGEIAAAHPDGASVRNTRPNAVVRGYLVATIPLVLLFLPLLFHRSADPTIFGFNTFYFKFLTISALTAVGLPLIIGVACHRSRSVSPAYAFVLGLVAVVVGCLTVEMVLTYRLRLEDAFSQYSAWGHKRSLLFAFEATPNHKWVNAGATYTTDRFGFRTHLRGGTWEESGGTRIFTLGESAVFGYGLNDDETWPHRLEGRLRARLDDPSLNVVNAGNNGHTSLQTLFRFYTKVLPLKPSHVILYVGPNDLYGMEPDHLLISEEILFSGSVAQFWAAETRGQNLYARSLLFYLLQQRVPALGRIMRPAANTAPIASQSDRPRGHETPSQELQRLMETIGGTYIENIQTICLISQAKGIKPVIVTFMQNMGGRPRLLLQNNNVLLRKLASEKGITLIDAATAFESATDKRDYFFKDQYHPNQKGAEFIASTVAEGWQ
ncbi:MAG: hypothetical protein HY271_15940 [Deltaproteobacteria bacterium]|nr:hypothetical protein [Deltaproteobacteria bacterium]